MSTAALAKRIEDANEAYRNGSPIMSDAAFDTLEAQLRQTDPNHAWFNKTGAAVPSNGAWPKVKHTIPMRSLLKAQDEDDLRKWWPGKTVCVTHKLDGISIALTYRDRDLVQAVTRGDGEIGEDITRNVLMMQGAVRKLPARLPDGSQTPAIVNVRGEIVCRKSDFKANFPGESNPRNTAAGTAKRQSNAAKAKHLTVMAYQFLPDGEAEVSKSTEMASLLTLGFTVPDFYVCGTLNAVVKVYTEYVSTKRDALDWEIDGLVIDVDDRDKREDMGEKNHRPAGAIAFKFPHEQKPTILRNIRWQVGKSGRLTPVADFDTVVLAGARVSKASLHNLDYMVELAEGAKQQWLCKGDEIMVARRNDVIPYVEELLTPSPVQGAFRFEVPTECPDCQTQTERKGAYVICPNGDTCPAQISGAVKRWIAKVGVKHFGTSLIDLLCETGKVSTIADLYRLDPKDVAMMDMGGRKVGGTASKAFTNLHKLKDLPIHVFVGSLGIEMIGRSMAKTIADAGYDSLNKMSKARIPEIAAISGVGQTKATNFCDGFWDLLDRGIITDLMGVGVTIAKPATGPMKGEKICMTGFRDDAMTIAIESNGGTVSGSVSKSTTILVVKDINTTSGKATKAAKYGTEVIDIDEMWDRLGGKP